MSHLANLKAANSLTDLARLLSVSPAGLSFVLYKIPAADKYRSFSIPKKSGGVRKISAPTPKLKLIQRRLANLLLDIQSEIETKHGIKANCTLAHGFKRDFSIVTNASNHRNKRYVFNVDLKDFFPSINFGRVYGFFIKNRNYALNPKVATIIAQIACNRNQLPQGSPCSPVISNIIAHIMDIHIGRLAAQKGCTYTRYADDLSFSTNKKSFPEEIARTDPTKKHIWVAGDGLLSRVYRGGFRLNPLKTRMQYRDSRQDTTGLIVNKKINIPIEYYKRARSMCHELVTTGTSYHTVNGSKIPVSDETLRGMLSHIFYIRGLETNHQKIPEGQKKPAAYHVYEDFLNYIWFYGILQPTIICEGKTDNIYLRGAIRKLAGKFPELVTMNAGKPTFHTNYFNYNNTTKVVMNLSGGFGELNKLVADYKTKIKKFKGGLKFPVIIVIDNDSGSKGMFSLLKTLLNSQSSIDGSKEFYYVYRNLYVVPIPKVGSKPTMIEDLFDPVLLKTILDGKTLDLSGKEKNMEKFYSKYVFAEQIVKKERANINFDSFEPLLRAIVKVQADYAAKLAAAPV